MIRINLLAEKQKLAAPSRFTLDEGKKIALAGGLLVALAMGYVGWSFWSMGQEEASLNAEIDAARAEEQRLIKVISEVHDFEARRERLEQRVSLIEELRRGQTAPVHILDQISRNLPDQMWLTRVGQSGYDLTIEGNCLSLTSLSDFVGALEQSRYFARPVEIVNSEVVAATSTAPELIKFSVKAGFQMAGLKSVAAPAATTPPAKGGARG
ncbi:MAG: PilN domain-containing protein [Vicinamibacterales bacterium]